MTHLCNVVAVFKQTGTVWENYAPARVAPGQPSRRDFVGWTGIGPIAFLATASGLMMESVLSTAISFRSCSR